MTAPKYDVHLGAYDHIQGFRTFKLARLSAPLVSARFSSGQQSESDLNLLKTTSLESVQGGMFQRDWEDPQKAARVVGVFNKYDKNLYPTPPRSSATAISSGYYPVAKVESDAISFIAYGAFSAGVYYNILHKITYGSGVTAITLPAALASNGFSSITGLELHKKYLFVASTTITGNQTCHRYDIAAGTWQDMTGALAFFFSMRGLLYGIGADSNVWSVTNETVAGAATYTLLCQAGSQDPNCAPADAKVFNGAAYIAKPDGIFRFDGVTATKVLSLVTNELRVFNGAIFFRAGDWLYRFDGITVQRLQFFGNIEKISPAYGTSMAMASDSDYLYVATIVQTSGYATGDKVDTVASGLRRIYIYDDVGFFLLHEEDVTLGTGYNPTLVTNHDKLYDVFGNIVASTWETNYYSFTISDFFKASAVTTASRFEITTSEFDDYFPNVFKALEELQANYSNIVAGDSLAVSYQYFDGETWSSWNSLGNLTSLTPSRVQVVTESLKLFKKLKVNLTGSFVNGSTFSFKGLGQFYTLQPESRWQWQVGLMAVGNKLAEDRTRQPITDDSNALSNYITKSIERKTPSYFLPPDYGRVKASVNAAATTFIVKGQLPLYTDPYGRIRLIAAYISLTSEWEIMRVDSATYNSSNDETTIVVKERGYLGITAHTIGTDAEVRPCYRVYINRLMNEEYVLDPNIYNEQTTGESQIQRNFLLEVTEV